MYFLCNLAGIACKEINSLKNLIHICYVVKVKINLLESLKYYERLA